MKIRNIQLGMNVDVHETTSINNVLIHDNVKIGKRCSIFGGEMHTVEIGKNSYIGMNCLINGYHAPVAIGENCSIAQNVVVMTDSGPNASEGLQRIFPMKKGPVSLGNHCWLGVGVVIMPNVRLGDYSIVAANSFVNKSFDGYVVIGGNPARLIRRLTEQEILTVKDIK